jgi:hypothetical protein
MDFTKQLSILRLIFVITPAFVLIWDNFSCPGDPCEVVKIGCLCKLVDVDLPVPIDLSGLNDLCELVGVDLSVSNDFCGPVDLSDLCELVGVDVDNL